MRGGAGARRLALGWLLRFAPERAACWTACWAELDPHELGRLGEELVARRLAASGWRIRGRRLDSGAGEIDLLAREPGTSELVCLEVKTARAEPLPRIRGAAPSFGGLAARPIRNLKRGQTRRLARAARAVGAGRVDLVEVELVRGRAPVVRHTPGFPLDRDP